MCFDVSELPDSVFGGIHLSGADREPDGRRSLDVPVSMKLGASGTTVPFGSAPYRVMRTDVPITPLESEGNLEF
jgi:hypothetical protein